MISYLIGTVAALHALPNNRWWMVLEVNQVGYDLQILPRSLDTFTVGASVQVFTHLHWREDQQQLFGFLSPAERDLFRQLIAVSGIGPQLGLALLDTLGIQDLVQAIVSSNIRMLSRTPGVGAKTAERISLELRNKLAEWRNQSGLVTMPPDAAPLPAVQEDVEMTLLALGYSTQEILQALRAVGQYSTLSKSDDVELWIREAIAWLSRD
jgi:Holliday junction DNA helicase RuvA